MFILYSKLLLGPTLLLVSFLPVLFLAYQRTIPNCAFTCPSTLFQVMRGTAIGTALHEHSQDK